MNSRASREPMKKIWVHVIPNTLIACAVVLLVSIAHAQSTPAAFNIPDPAIEQRIQDLLAKMTIEEKVGQLNQYSAGQSTGPGTGRSNYTEMIAAGRIGSLLNVAGAKQTNDLQRIAVEKSRLKIPLLFG